MSPHYLAHGDSLFLFDRESHRVFRLHEGVRKEVTSSADLGLLRLKGVEIPERRALQLLDRGPAAGRGP
jgi:hypothetical protein